ncbi:MAG TPA: glycosyltransferase [Nitriliruptorales bacterium]|nr:glycosyltransferase [Nitriliruptorales bacterium]
MSDLAGRFGGHTLVLHPMGRLRALLPIRYLLSSVGTVVVVVARRPAVVVVTNPPIAAALVTFVAGKLVGSRLVLDSHPGGFGLQDDPLGRWVQPLHRWLVRRVAAVLVTTRELSDLVDSWGGNGIVFHEAPPPSVARRPAEEGPSARPTVVFAGIFARDEPVEEATRAASLEPRVEMQVTGDVGRAPRQLVRHPPPNVRLVGFLPQERYVRLLAGADVALVLSTEELSVPRAALEASHLEVPLVVTDGPASRRYFPYAERVRNEAEEIAAAIRRWLAMHPEERASRVRRARLDAEERWRQQRGALAPLLTPSPGGRTRV